jgi:hypothetical protein
MYRYSTADCIYGGAARNHAALKRGVAPPRPHYLLTYAPILQVVLDLDYPMHVTNGESACCMIGRTLLQSFGTAARSDEVVTAVCVCIDSVYY